MARIDDSIFDELGEMLDEGPSPALGSGDGTELAKWSPSLGPTQQKIFDSTAKYILVHGNRGSGKTFICGGHKLVRHCYENFNAEALIIVGVRSQATQGGVWTKLETEILPMWREGIGLKYTEEKMDEQRYRYRFVRNCFGGWSRITLISVPWGEHIRGRIKGFEPSYVFVDELVTLKSPDYFDAVVQQLGRRPGVKLQQYTAATNPDGPRHWVYKRFFETPWEESKDAKGKIVSRKGIWDKRYAVFHLQMKENKEHLSTDYYQGVVDATRQDPVEYQRMVEGKWIDRPTGKAIFKDVWDPETHIRGKGGHRLLPNPKYSAILGYDLGSANNAIIFLQCVPSTRGLCWFVFDEMVYVNRRLPYQHLVKGLYKRMEFWNRVTGSNLFFEHISDDSAFNQFRPGQGSYDVLDVERCSKELLSQFPGMVPIRMKPAPKFQGSVEARIRLVMEMLGQNRLFVSDACHKIKEMFMHLEGSKDKRGGEYDPLAMFKPKRSPYLHPFDAMTYPMIALDLGGHRFSASSRPNPVKSSIVEFGSAKRDDRVFALTDLTQYL